MSFACCGAMPELCAPTDVDRARKGDHQAALAEMVGLFHAVSELARRAGRYKGLL